MKLIFFFLFGISFLFSNESSAQVLYTMRSISNLGDPDSTWVWTEANIVVFLANLPGDKIVVHSGPFRSEYTIVSDLSGWDDDANDFFVCYHIKDENGEGGLISYWMHGEEFRISSVKFIVAFRK